MAKNRALGMMWLQTTSSCCQQQHESAHERTRCSNLSLPKRAVKNSLESTKA